MVVERLVLHALRRRGVLIPALLRTALVVPLEVVLAQRLFWAPCKAHGVSDSIVGNVAAAIAQGLRLAGLAA